MKKNLVFLIFIWIASCKPYSKLQGKWIASFQESYLIYNFNGKSCIETYDNPKGKVSIIKYNYVLKEDTLYLYDVNSKNISQKYAVSFEKKAIVKFDNMILQKYSKINKVKPILNKPDF